RSPVERSKVIRLGPEFKLPSAPPTLARPGLSLDALAAMAAAAEAARVPATLKPPRKERTQIGVGPNRTSGANASGNADLATPLPATLVLKTPPLVTPPPPNAAPLVAPPAIVMAPPPATTPVVPPIIKTNGATKNGHSNGTSGHAAPATSDAGEPTPPPTPPPKAAPVPFEPLAVFPNIPVDPDESMATPPPATAAPAYSVGGINGSGGVAAPVFGDRLSAPFSGGTAQAPMSGPFAGSATVVTPQKSGKGKLLLALLVLLGGAAAYVHLRVAPLNLLPVWMKPASLQVTSDPAGADIKLDGRPVGGPTPAKVDVKRDRAAHVLEVSKEGFEPASKTIRFDEAAELSASLTLTALPPPPPKEEPKEEPKKEEAAVEAKDGEKAGDKTGDKADDAKTEAKSDEKAKDVEAKAGEKAKAETKTNAPEEKKSGKAHKTKAKKKKGKKSK
ncbi:MAG TPA: PEGA domain-containing protein, partial [Polyangia bacterium]|nr:PEGA domain-containing protein [Polyangia bacterium]